MVQRLLKDEDFFEIDQIFEQYLIGEENLKN